EGVARPLQVARSGFRINGDLYGAGAVSGGDSRSHALARLDGFADRRAVRRAVLPRLWADAQIIQPLFRQRQADQPAAVLGHEVDGFRRDFLGGESQIAFVLAVFIVHYDHHAAGADLFNSALDAAKRRIHTALFSHAG